MRYLLGLIGFLALLEGAAARATENVSYTYDAKGRLVKVVRSGSTNNGITVQYSHDKADNRTNVKVTGAH